MAHPRDARSRSSTFRRSLARAVVATIPFALVACDPGPAGHNEVEPEPAADELHAAVLNGAAYAASRAVEHFSLALPFSEAPGEPEGRSLRQIPVLEADEDEPVGTTSITSGELPRSQPAPESAPTSPDAKTRAPGEKAKSVPAAAAPAFDSPPRSAAEAAQREKRRAPSIDGPMPPGPMESREQGDVLPARPNPAAPTAPAETRDPLR